jgi:hypothetical protein
MYFRGLMSNRKVLFIIEESFKTEERELRLSSLQNAFLKLIKTYEVIEEHPTFNTTNKKKENTNG